VAATADDEHNVLAAARAKSMGAESAIAVLQRPTYLHLLTYIGIDRPFSPRSTAVEEIQRLMTDSALHVMATLAAGVADVFEVRVPAKASRVIGVPLKQLKLPGQCIVAAMQRAETVKVPGANDAFEAGDTLVLIAPSAATHHLETLFGIKSFSRKESL